MKHVTWEDVVRAAKECGIAIDPPLLPAEQEHVDKLAQELREEIAAAVLKELEKKA